MIADHFTWDTPWELYFHILIFIPILQRLIFLGEPALKAVQLHGHHLKWLFERLKEVPKGYSIAAKFTVGLLVPATIALMRFFKFPNAIVLIFFLILYLINTYQVYMFYHNFYKTIFPNSIFYINI